MGLDETYDDDEKIVKEPFISICNKCLASLCVFMFILLTLGVIGTALYFSISRQLLQRLPALKDDRFNVSLYSRFPNPTQLALSPTGNVFAGTNTDGGIYVVYPDGNFTRILSGLSNPTGIAFHEGSLYVATKESILFYKNIENDLTKIPEPVILTQDLNLGITYHQQRYMKIHNGKIWIMVGSPCNACLNSDPASVYGKLASFDLNGQNSKSYHTGIRNSGGFDWHPVTGDFYFTDEGREWSGVEVPDEINVVKNHGNSTNLDFGFPLCYGKDLVDPEFNVANDCKEKTPALYEIGPHVGPRGMTFYNGTAFPAEYHKNIFIAENGIWRSNNKTGFRITRIQQSNSSAPYQVFMDGWVLGSIAWGKPSDILNLPDGSLLIADELYGAIFRVYSNQ